MKKHVIIAMMLFTCIMFSQTKKNGTVYNEHPAINAVESMTQAFYAGDADKVASYLTDDFKSYQGTSLNKDDKGRDKEWFLGGVKWIKENWSYVSYTRTSGAYPDAIEYKGDSGIWVQTWDQLKAMDNATGVMLDMPQHRLYKMTSDNKIQTMIIYDNDLPWAERSRSFAPRTNGTIYVNHEYINTVRKMMGALANGDADKAFSYFTDNAVFTNLDMADGESHTVAEEKEGFLGMLKDWTIESIDVRGYPDYLEYELGNSKAVQSWWTARMTRKSDGKKVKLPLMMIHDFNDDGKITREAGYYTAQALAAK
ncbi:nuclear transport factor 2 family protein [Gaetbulibacter aquiaggeris]|uniref:Nuclear transport factor 2 family protein n=1 Tax=Gaetbulibacter aquiaggeris TaxID=1735373 RepID=A0ABW7MQ93_9FLAO